MNYNSCTKHYVQTFENPFPFDAYSNFTDRMRKPSEEKTIGPTKNA